MEDANWDPRRVKMLLEFWRNLHKHPYYSSRDTNKQRAILIYQGEQRQKWHRALAQGAWDIGILSDRLLLDAFDRAYRLEREKLDALRDVHIVSGTTQGTTSSTSTPRGRVDGASSRTAKAPARAAADPYPRDRKAGFPDGASGAVLSACAICLGRHRHRVYDCDASQTWNGAFATMARRDKKDFTLNDGRALCYDWQRSKRCTSTLHDSRHLCSGCSLPTHGAQTCPRAEPAPPANPVPGK
ncbi:uncharacterized protein B0H18DRAFT_1009283 [Fomitopsis serialis]|uniref:uncharacterized protein n=1 Tax=Fomitopsis serialis TaxID=139415 RepID=UPI0020076F5D|nr:uncharacterized protein B0H18DRAFT_1073290 [Neoantrodia serialis]XP_047893010.1 uncharacterized protein B0H18DRAFT_1009283 [Neoantrodia serialis]KAH9909463.1 hypothetical protein B0H18DRAFT_1073290 [Neoantrodia serialis]KAH9925249.1 hypothetical protein B0H18DRAFT_1009283 [Neoantrodia serialis]